jgi:uncharacterized membrane-anchored protein
MLVRTALIVALIALPFAALADIPPPSDTPALPDTTAPAPVPETAPAESPAAPADGVPTPSAEEIKANGLVKRDGTITLEGGQARVVVAEGFAYLDKADTMTLLTELWGNPPDAVTGALGAIVPKDVSVLAPESWAAIITYENDGHVADDDAESINYDDMLKEMQDATVAENDERVKAGYQAISLVGWAQKPTYDKAEHKLHWAKHLRFGGDANTLNYSIRALGRTGVLQVNVVADMKQLPDINKQVPKLLSMVSFDEGNRYADFQEGTDPVAAYGLAALVAGGVAAKAGLLKGLLVFLAASWKFIAIGVAVLGGAIWRFFAGRKTPSV